MRNSSCPNDFQLNPQPIVGETATERFEQLPPDVSEKPLPLGLVVLYAVNSFLFLVLSFFFLLHNHHQRNSVLLLPFLHSEASRAVQTEQRFFLCVSSNARRQIGSRRTQPARTIGGTSTSPNEFERSSWYGQDAVELSGGAGANRVPRRFRLEL